MLQTNKIVYEFQIDEYKLKINNKLDSIIDNQHLTSNSIRKIGEETNFHQKQGKPLENTNVTDLSLINAKLVQLSNPLQLNHNLYEGTGIINIEDSITKIDSLEHNDSELDEEEKINVKKFDNLSETKIFNGLKHKKTEQTLKEAKSRIKKSNSVRKQKNAANTKKTICKNIFFISFLKYFYCLII